MGFFQSKKRKEESFRDQLSQYIEEIIKLSFEFADNQEESLAKIHAIGAMELESYFFMPIYQINDEILEINQIKNQDEESAFDLQDSAVEILKQMVAHFRGNSKDAPTQVKIEYSLLTQEFNYDLEYDLIWSNKEDGGLPSDEYYNWLEQLKNEQNK